MKKIYWALIATILASFNPAAYASVWDYVPGMGGDTTPPATAVKQPQAAKGEESEDAAPTVPAVPQAAKDEESEDAAPTAPAVPQAVTEVTPAAQPQAAHVEGHEEEAEEPETEETEEKE